MDLRILIITQSQEHSIRGLYNRFAQLLNVYNKETESISQQERDEARKEIDTVIKQLSEFSLFYLVIDEENDDSHVEHDENHEKYDYRWQYHVEKTLRFQQTIENYAS